VGMAMPLLGVFLVVGYYLWRGLVYLRWSRRVASRREHREKGGTGMELAEEPLCRSLTYTTPGPL